MSKLRLVYTGQHTGAKVKYNSEWEEYVGIPFRGTVNSSATYHTDDKQDAIATADRMTLGATD